MTDKVTQTRAILALLREGHTITPMDALFLVGSMRLAARIYDIRHDGLLRTGEVIVREMVDNVAGERFAAYHMEEHA